METSRFGWLWGAAVALVLVGWAAGYRVWDPESPGAIPGPTLDLFLPALTLLVGVPLAVASGVLLASTGRRGRALGYAAFLMTCVALMYLASFAFFGGFCLDPEDVCVTTWPSRIAELGVAIGCVGVGWLTQRRRGRRGLARQSRTLSPE